MESENVKERLNSLLHKKISDLQEKEREIKEEEQQEVKQEADDKCETPYLSEDTNISSELPESCITPYTYYPLREILNEKKKALLANKDVINFIQNKVNNKPLYLFYFP